METSRRPGADHCINFSEVDPVQEIMRLTDRRGVEVAIDALGAVTTGLLRVRGGQSDS
jgi:alcohol dehydrogenase